MTQEKQKTVIRVKYDPKTTLVLGFFPSDIEYPNNDIKLKKRTIDDFPFVEISLQEHLNLINSIRNPLSVVDGVVQKYKIPFNEQLETQKRLKIKQLEKNYNDFRFGPVEYKENLFQVTTETKMAITYIITSLPTLASESEYFNYPNEDIVMLTKADFKAIAALIQMRDTFAQKQKKHLINKINNCSILAELSSINLNFALDNEADLDGKS